MAYLLGMAKAAVMASEMSVILSMMTGVMSGQFGLVFIGPAIKVLSHVVGQLTSGSWSSKLQCYHQYTMLHTGRYNVVEAYCRPDNI